MSSSVDIALMVRRIRQKRIKGDYFMMNEYGEEEKALRWALENGILTPTELEELIRQLETKKSEDETSLGAMKEQYGDPDSDEVVDQLTAEYEEGYLASASTAKEQSLIILVATIVMATVFAVSTMVALNQDSILVGLLSVLVVFCSGLALLECLHLLKLGNLKKNAHQNALSEATTKCKKMAEEKEALEERHKSTEKLLEILREY